MTPYRNQRLEPQKSLVRLVQMMIFLFKKNKVEFLRVLSEPSPFIFLSNVYPPVTAQLVFRDVEHPTFTGGETSPRPLGGNPNNSFFARVEGTEPPSSLISFENFQVAKISQGWMMGTVPPNSFSMICGAEKNHHFYIHLKTGCLRYQEGLRINMTGDSCFFRKITMGK